MTRGFVAAAALALFMQSAIAAPAVVTIGQLSGKVLVNSGDGFVPAQDGQVLAAGAKVLVGEESAAVVSYEKCDVTLGKPIVHVVQKDVNCDVISPVADVPVAPPVGSGVSPLLLLGGAAATVGIIVLLHDDDDDPETTN